MKTIHLRGTECRIEFGRYNNGTVAMQAVEAESGEPFADLTVNWEANWEGNTPYREFFKFPCVVLKNYSENAGLVEELQAQGVIEPGGACLSGSNGTVEVRALTAEWQQAGRCEYSRHPH
jgi:hypothetical protein